MLKATCTGTINGEDVTAVGSDYVAQLTTHAIEYYAAVEKQFAEQNGVLDDTATAEAAKTADSLWSSNGDLYTANGISKSSVEAYLLNAQKAKVLLKMTYGPDGTSPVTDAEYTDYVNNDCYYIEAVQFPLVNYSTYSMADDDQKAAIMATAESCMAELNETATAETASSSALYTAAMTYVPEAMAAMGSTMDASQAVYYAASQLYTPSDLSSYGSDEYNNLTDPLDAAGMNHWTTIDLGTTVLVARKIDPFKTYTVEDLDSMYDLLTSMKSDAIQDELYAAGAALDHDLNSAAMNTYSASKIKRTSEPENSAGSSIVCSRLFVEEGPHDEKQIHKSAFADPGLLHLRRRYLQLCRGRRGPGHRRCGHLRHLIPPVRHPHGPEQCAHQHPHHPLHL